jgi:hypothetical protein
MYKIHRIGTKLGKKSLHEKALRALAKRMVLYPIVQALGRSGFAWYEGAYGNTVPLLDSVSQAQYDAMIFCILITPTISVGYLVIFLVMQPEAMQHFQALLCCRKFIPSPAKTIHKNHAAFSLPTSHSTQYLTGLHSRHSTNPQPQQQQRQERKERYDVEEMRQRPSTMSADGDGDGDGDDNHDDHNDDHNDHEADLERSTNHSDRGTNDYGNFSFNSTNQPFAQSSRQNSLQGEYRDHYLRTREEQYSAAADSVQHPPNYLLEDEEEAEGDWDDDELYQIIMSQAVHRQSHTHTHTQTHSHTQQMHNRFASEDAVELSPNDSQETIENELLKHAHMPSPTMPIMSPAEHS